MQAIAATILRPHPVRIFVGGTEDGVLVAHTAIAQDVRVVSPVAKPRLLRELVAGLDPTHKTLVFVRRRRLCDELTEEYSTAGLPYGVDGLHGDREQRDRAAAMKGFKEGRTKLLFATDVAARGLDVSDITLVINFDFPVQRGAGGIEDYVHRIGRTARAGGRGASITFFTEEHDGESARGLVKLLKDAGQPVPTALTVLVASQGEGGEVDAATVKREAKKEARKKAKLSRPGDWECAKCGARVFAKHQACFKCKSPKPTSGPITFD